MVGGDEGRWFMFVSEYWYHQSAMSLLLSCSNRLHGLPPHSVAFILESKEERGKEGKGREKGGEGREKRGARGRVREAKIKI